ncbi:MAG: S-layer homology domain-containing protein, partial [Anaerotignum sp.]
GQRPEGMEPPEGMQKGERPADGQLPADFEERMKEEFEKRGEEMPADFMEKLENGEMPDGRQSGGMGGGSRQMASSSDTITEAFRLSKNSKTFTNVSSVVNASTFTDVAKDAWYYNAVTSAASKGILTGATETTFAPSATMTRGEALEAVYALAGKPAAGEASFSDIDAKDSYYAAAAWAEKNGILTDIAEGKLAAETKVTREELVQMLYNYLGDGAEGRVPAAAFTDTDRVTAENAFAWALDSNIISGNQESLRPTALVTKAEAAIMLTNAYK